MINFSEECKTIYRLARLDAGIRDEDYDGDFQDISGAFTRVIVYLDENPDALSKAEYTELYEETMMLKAMAISEEAVFAFDSADKLLEFAKTSDFAEVRELFALDEISDYYDMSVAEFKEYYTARKKRWKNGFKLTRETFYQEAPMRNVKPRPSSLPLR